MVMEVVDEDGLDGVAGAGAVSVSVGLASLVWLAV